MLSNYPGTQDRFTGDILLRQWILEQFQHTYRLLGFNLLETPCLEPSEVLAKEGGVGDQPVYVFDDKHRDRVCLKPDQTVSLRRVVEQHGMRLPYARHQVGLAFRQDKPEKGRWREFTQCDADVIGAPVGIPDAETVLWLLEGFDSIGLPETVLFVNERRVLSGLYGLLGKSPFPELTFVRAMDKVARDGDLTPVLKYLEAPSTRPHLPDWSDSNLDIAYDQSTRTILGLLEEVKEYRGLQVRDALKRFGMRFEMAAEAVSDLDQVVLLAEEAGADLTRVSFDPCLARGMDYYTGPVFEAFCPAWPYGSVAGGGRYDRMVTVEGVAQPAVGASFGLERIEQALKDLGRVPSECTQRVADVLIIVKPDWMPGIMRAARTLREAGVHTMVYPDPAVTLKLQTRFAAQNGIPLAVFFGPDEQEQNTVTLRIVTAESDVSDPDAARKSKNVTIPFEQLVQEARRLIENPSLEH